MKYAAEDDEGGMLAAGDFPPPWTAEDWERAHDCADAQAAVALTYCVRLWRELERCNARAAHNVMSDLAAEVPRVLDLLTERERDLVKRRQSK